MQRLKGIAATLLILALLAGTPMLLLALGSNPLSGERGPPGNRSRAYSRSPTTAPCSSA